MTPARFTETTRQHGLYRKGMGIEATRELALLVQTPVPVVKPKSWHERSVAPSCLKWMGKLIAAGFAQRDGDHYRATQKGVEWLGKIIDLQILPIPQTTSLQS